MEDGALLGGVHRFAAQHGVALAFDFLLACEGDEEGEDGGGDLLLRDVEEKSLSRSKVKRLARSASRIEEPGEIEFVASLRA